MKQKEIVAAIFVAAAFSSGLFAVQKTAYAASPAAAQSADEVPTFRYDPDWPKPLPSAWITGNIGAMTTDKQDHIWVVQRPNSTTSLGERDFLDETGDCCTPAPPVMEFDQAGKVLQTWGPIHVTDPQTKKEKLVGTQVSGPYPDGLWPVFEHSIFIDHKNNVWITNRNPPSQLVKFTNDGKFLLRIGKQTATSSGDRENFAGPAGVYVDAKRNEVFVADGYENRRIIVFDADTGTFKRMWGAYGKPPTDPQHHGQIEVGIDQAKRREQFSMAHCIVGSNDGLLYVCDRGNGRVQVFKMDGTYVNEVFIAPRDKGKGTVFGIGFSGDRDQKFMYVGDASNKKVHIVRRKDLTIVGSFGSGGRGGGQFGVIHTLTSDSHGNVYVGETVDNNRVQRFLFTGMAPAQK